MHAVLFLTLYLWQCHQIWALFTDATIGITNKSDLRVSSMEKKKTPTQRWHANLNELHVLSRERVFYEHFSKSVGQTGIPPFASIGSGDLQRHLRGTQLAVMLWSKQPLVFGKYSQNVMDITTHALIINVQMFCIKPFCSLLLYAIEFAQHRKTVFLLKALWHDVRGAGKLCSTKRNSEGTEPNSPHQTNNCKLQVFCKCCQCRFMSKN